MQVLRRETPVAWSSSPTAAPPSPWHSRGPCPGDVVLLAGKGHETNQEVEGRLLPFDDRVVVADLLGSGGGGADRALADGGGRRRPVGGDLDTPLLIRWLRAPPDRPAHPGGRPGEPRAKAGTPTMGGVAIVAGGHLRLLHGPRRPGGALRPHGVPGAHCRRRVRCSSASLDDWIKVRHRRSLGLNKRGKFGGPGRRGVVFAELAVHWAHTSTALSFTRLQTPGSHLGEVGWVVFAAFVLVGHLQRGQPHRRARRAGRGFRHVLLRGARRSWATGSSGTSPSTRCCPPSALDLALGSVALAGGVPRVPVVERGAGADHHGRHRLARHRLGPRARSASC